MKLKRGTVDYNYAMKHIYALGHHSCIGDRERRLLREALEAKEVECIKARLSGVETINALLSLVMDKINERA